jgi:hypothetical protein
LREQIGCFSEGTGYIIARGWDKMEISDKLFIMDVIWLNRGAVLYLCLLSFLSCTLPLAASGTFKVSASPSALSSPQNGQGVSTITTAISGGFNSSISLSATGVPMGTTVSFNPETIPARGAGNSTMTITVGSSAPTGTYPITVTGNGGGTLQNTTVSLTVTAQQYDVGIDFRNTQNYVIDPAYAVFDNCLNDGTTQQTRTNSNGQSVTWQWSQECNAPGDESNSVDPRLAGGANVYNPGAETLTITLPQAGTYNIGFATGVATGNQCGGGECSNFIFKDGTSGTQLFTVNPNNPGTGHFIDAANHNWTAAQWPSSNQKQPITLSGTTLTVSMASMPTNLAHIRITYAQQQQNFSISVSPASLSIARCNQGTSMGASPILTVAGIPAFFLLPGTLLLLTIGLCWSLEERWWPAPDREEFPFKCTEPNFWLVSVIVSLLIAIVPWLFTKRWYFSRYGLQDIGLLWFASILAGIGCYVIWWFYRNHRRLQAAERIRLLADAEAAKLRARTRT